ncbi:uncharacterized protein LOC115482927 [Drosophila hydei]|uniref:Uncharacterized protein LOC115482927 n=1 Tax=Drosophila hydei TaxID=7224 RepID=A0A6J2SN12_DROHY|nr:uncharacterized protein LOC115482927 [Drosophila hydei]
MFGWLWILICLGLSTSAEQRSFRFVIKEFYIKPTVPDVMESVNWTMPNRSTISIALILKREIDKMDLETSLDVIRTGKQIMRLYQIRLDACQFLTTIHKNRIFNLFANSVNKGSNGYLRCPLKPNFNYTLVNWYMDEKYFPNYVPECNFRVSTKFYSHSKMIVTSLNLGSVVFNN